MTPVPLEEIADVIRGVTFAKADATDVPSEGLLPVLRAGNISDELDVKNNLVFVDQDKISPKQVLQESDIVVCMSSGSASVLGKSAILKSDWNGSFGAFLATVRPDPRRTNPAYVSHFLRSPIFRRWASGSSGIGIKNIRASDLKKFPIPLPPLDEQNRIAAILDQADALRRLRQRSISIIEGMKTALFHQMFSESADTRPLGSIIKVGSGNGLTAKDMHGGDVPVYGGNGINGWHDEAFVDPQTVIIGRVGVYCGAVHITEKRAWVTDNALIVKKLIDIETDYLAEALRAANLNQYAGRSAQPLVSGSRIYPVEIPLPPIESQRMFTARTSAIAGPQAALQKSLNAIELLFSSLQHGAFRGEL